MGINSNKFLLNNKEIYVAFDMGYSQIFTHAQLTKNLRALWCGIPGKSQIAVLPSEGIRNS